MPTAAEHHAWALQNETFYNELGGCQSQQPDWAMTVLYYVALHEIEAALVSDGCRVHSHEERKAKMQQKWPILRRWHDHLYQHSRDARYRCRRPSQKDLTLAEAALRGVRDEIAKITPRPY